MILDQERDKYQRMWARPEYRQWSPGEAVARTFLETCPWTSGETIIDLGCGTGRAGRVFAAAGLQVRLLDICRDGVEVDDLPFTEAPLWALPPGLSPFDWIFCVDVLEHLPIEYVGLALDEMASLTIKGGLFKIALFEDQCGALIGQRLHQTVQPASWWLPRIRARWTVTHDGQNGGYLLAVLGEPVCRQKPI